MRIRGLGITGECVQHGGEIMRVDQRMDVEEEEEEEEEEESLFKADAVNEEEEEEEGGCFI